MSLLALWLATSVASSHAGTLSTTTAGGNGSSGALFEVYAANNLTISDLTSYSYSATSGCSYLIYYTTSTMSSVLYTPSAWTLVGSGTHGATSAGGAWTATLTTPVTMTAGQRIALYVTYTSCTMQYTNGTSLGRAYASNSDMTIYEGHGRSYSSTFSTGLNTPRVWNGTITYSTCSTTTYYADADGDGYGDASSTTSACTRPSGYVGNSRDCDDTSSSNHPGASEVCDGDDNDCDGSTDESSAVDASTWYRDNDGDGYGRASSTTVACDQPSNYVANSTDCDDTDSGVNPAASEYCDGEDDDCDGTTDEASAVDAATWYADADADGYGDASIASVGCSAPVGYVALGTDCNDGNAAVSPGDAERCNSIDDDCDGTTDEASAVDASTWYRDADSDGYGNASVSTPACTVPAGYVADATDCRDTDSAANPGATERCDGDDDDCDGSVDEDSSADAATWYLDVDGDGYGVTTTTTASCSAPTGYVALGTDCDDADATEYPGAAERCDGDDDDCDGTTDEGSAIDAATWYSDSDGDGYGDSRTGTPACTAPVGSVADDTDCDDGNSAEHPGATEFCDGDDDDCDGITDETDAIDASVWYADADNDGYGDVSDATTACSEPAGYVADATDCDDAAVATYPGATETPYDTIDQDCSGADLCDVDEDGHDAPECAGDDCLDDDPLAYTGAVEAWYTGIDEACDGGSDYDADLDGYDSLTYGGTDCDDGAADTYPGAPDVPYDGVVTDCNSVNDNDLDRDGYEAESEGGDDCDDANSLVHPGASDAWYDGVDADCDGGSDYDADQDGWDSSAYGGEDCDDTSASIYPNAPDTPYDGEIEDCDESDEYDADGDGADSVEYGGGDCADTVAAIHPGAVEELDDGVDSDCDGMELCYADADQDGQVGVAAPTVLSDDLDCTDAGEGEAEVDFLDCDDADPTIFYGAQEVCGDGVDNSCEGSIDERCAGADTGDTGVEEEPSACGCDAGSAGAAGAAVVLAALAGWARRRRGA